MGKCPHCGSKSIRRRYREHRRYKWRCRSCNRVFRSPKRGGALWLIFAAVVVLAVVIFAVQQDMISLPPALSPIERQIDQASEVMIPNSTPIAPVATLTTKLQSVSTSVAENAPKVQATIDTSARSAAETVSDVLLATRVPSAKPDLYHTPTPEPTRGKSEIDIRQLEDRTHQLINAQRVKRGLSPLEHIEKIRLIARSHSEDMAKRSYFSHDTPEGLDPTDRGERAGYHCRKDYGTYYSFGLAENIHQGWLSSSTTYIYGIPFHDWNTQEEIAVAAVEGWMTSPGHRRNILDASYDRSGIGVAIAEDDKVYITQNFC